MSAKERPNFDELGIPYVEPYAGKFSTDSNGVDMSETSAAPGGSEIFSSPTRDLPNTVVTLRRKCHPELLTDIHSLTATELSTKYKSEYSSWKNMKSRRKRDGYIVDPDFENFIDFLEIMGRKPDSSYSIDRIDPANPEYSPDNCRWASKKLQTWNRTNTIYLTDDNGKCLPAAEWGIQTGLSSRAIAGRISRGWSEHEAIHTLKGDRRKSLPTSFGSTESAEPYVILWREVLTKHHNVKFVAFKAKDKKLLKDIGSLLRQGGIDDPFAALRLILEDWSGFTSHADSFAHYELKRPIYPSIEFLITWITAAGDYYLKQTASKGEPSTNPHLRIDFSEF